MVADTWRRVVRIPCRRELTDHARADGRTGRRRDVQAVRPHRLRGRGHAAARQTARGAVTAKRDVSIGRLTVHLPSFLCSSKSCLPANRQNVQQIQMFFG